MPGCDTARNIQKYKGASASTLQDALENGNVATTSIQTSGYFIGDGSLLTGVNISGGSIGNLQGVTNNGATSTNKITLTNTNESLEAQGNVTITSGFFKGDGGLLSNTAGTTTFQQATDQGNVSTNTVSFTNAAESITTSGNIVVGTNVYASEFYGSGTTLTGVALSSDLTSNASRVTSLESSVTTNASDITNLETDMTSNASRVTSLESSVTTNASDITSLETDMTSNASRVTSLRTDMTSNVTRIGDLEDNVIISNSSQITSGFLKGDIIYASANNTLARKGVGNEGEVLKVGSNDSLVWASDNIGDGSSAGNLQQVTTNGSTTANMISFQNTYTSLITYGDVGIGYTSPVEVGVPLKIKAASTSSGDDNAILIEQTDNSSSDHAIIKLKTPNSAGNPFINYNIDGQTNWSHGIDNSDSDKFKIANHATNLHTNTKLTLQTDGNLGIGTNTPDAKLEISGNVYASTQFEGNVNVSSTNYNVFGKKITAGTDGFEGDVNGSGTNYNVFGKKITAGTDGFVGHVNKNTTDKEVYGKIISTIENVSGSAFYGPISGSNNINANEITSTKLISSNIYSYSGNIYAYSGNIIGNVNVSGTSYNVYAKDFKTTTGDIIITHPSRGLYGPILGSNNISAEEITANSATFSTSITSNITTPTPGFVTADEITSTKLISSNIYTESGNIYALQGNIVGNVNVSGTNYNVYGKNFETSTGNIIINNPSSFGLYGNIKGSNNISANEITAAEYRGGGITTNHVSYYNGTKFVSITGGSDGQFLKFNESAGTVNAPSWATVSSTGSGTTPNLEDVTTEGATTDQTIIFNNTTTAFKTAAPTSSTTCGIANTSPVHTLDIGSNVAIIDDGIDKLYIRGNVYSTSSIIAMNEVRCDVISARESKIKNSTVVSEAPTRQIRSI